MSVVHSGQDQAVEASKALVASVRSPGFAEQVAAALPENVPAHRFVRATVTAVLANPDVALSDHASVLNALLRSAQDGLMPDGREAALVIYNTKVKDGGGERWVKKAQYLPMITGLRKVAAEHGWTIRTAVVYANDEFQHELGLDATLIHRPVRPGADRGQMIAAYAVAKHRDGRHAEFEVMYADEIAKARAASRASERGPWVDWTERMWEKTVGKRLFAKLPLDPNDKRVASMLDVAALEPGEAERMLYGPPAPSPAPALPAAREPIEGEITNGVHTDTPREQGDTAAQQADGGQQAAAGAESADEPAAAPDPDPEPEPPAAAAEPEPKAPTLAVARKVVLNIGAVKGRTIGDVAAGEGAETWLGWALRNLARFDADTAAAIQVVAKADVPDAWAKHVEKRSQS
ncbi:MAG: recombinase RecT [Polyangiaceae bacterium]|nr:recombinase RecT [Polyangiaceae bacterium]